MRNGGSCTLNSAASTLNASTDVPGQPKLFNEADPHAVQFQPTSIFPDTQTKRITGVCKSGDLRVTFIPSSALTLASKGTGRELPSPGYCSTKSVFTVKQGGIFMGRKRVQSIAAGFLLVFVDTDECGVFTVGISSLLEFQPQMHSGKGRTRGSLGYLSVPVYAFFS